MDLQDELRTAIIEELKRQAENSASTLKVSVAEEKLTVNGELDLDELVMVIAGAMAGGP
ncbi:hypothetical protein SAMN05216548_105125 [Faunimonas pinastri]|uniref:Uncharacterized protein n=1 Tax=Faunimonas pinastri TaxID=1855383 RepID=A0A1H9GRB9_9HYPH|nr:hypothetical protein [Faunimonas pinastri]SEQ52632.1 hypothetical protein SAMN05216548_105125 [Faunimonas pinastri]